MSSTQIAEKYGVTKARVCQWAKENGIPLAGHDGRASGRYVFDEELERKFAARKPTGRPRKMAQAKAERPSPKSAERASESSKA